MFIAREHNIRLIVKGTGHDYIGRSGAPNALSIWTHNLKGLQMHESFTSDNGRGTNYGPAITVAAGTLMQEIYEFADGFNRTVVGGSGGTVGVGGYLTGGGHSILSARHGLAADQVLEMEVVTSMGEILTVNERQHTDLFWALRGV